MISSFQARHNKVYPAWSVLVDKGAVVDCIWKQMFESCVSYKNSGIGKQLPFFLRVERKQASEHVEVKDEDRRHIVASSTYQARNDPPHAIPAVL